MKKMKKNSYKKELSGLEKYLTPQEKKLVTKKILSPSPWNINNLKRAKKTIDNIVRRKNVVLIDIKDINEFITEVSKSPRNLLILLSYCSKPTDCPLKRLSAECQPRASNNICNSCPFKNIKLKADKIRCEFYIDYNTKEMVREYLFPTFKQFKETGKFKPFIATTCPLALNRFLEMAIIVGFKGIVYQLVEGICGTSAHYDRGDRGEKIEVTNLNKENWQEINYILDKIIQRTKA